MTHSKTKTGILISVLLLCLLLLSCSQPVTNSRQESTTIEVKRTGGVTVDSDGDQLAEFLEGMVISDSLDMAYGVDLRVRRAYQLVARNRRSSLPRS